MEAKTHTIADSGIDNQGLDTQVDDQAEDWTQDKSFDLSEPDTDLEEEGDIFEELSQLYEIEEKLGEDLPNWAASLVNKALRSAIPSQREKEMMEKFFWPRNCPSLAVPKLNQDI